MRAYGAVGETACADAGEAVGPQQRSPRLGQVPAIDGIAPAPFQHGHRDQNSQNPVGQSATSGRGARGFRRERHDSAHIGAAPGGSGTANAFSRNEISV